MPSSKSRSVGPLLLVSALVLVVTVGLTVISGVSLAVHATQEAGLKGAISSKTQELQTLQTEHADTLALYQQYQIGGEIKRIRRPWSEVLSEVERTFSSYSVLHNFSGSEEEKATLTISTESYGDIVALIRLIKDKNPVFKDVFVPAVSQTTNEEGQVFFTLPFELFFSDAPTI